VVGVNTLSSKWQSPKLPIKLNDDEVHVWLSPLSIPASTLAILLNTLALDEKKKAGQFVFRKDRDRFVAARGILRAILGHYLRTEPGKLRFCYNSFGKPVLVGQTETEKINFNVSHSGDLGLFAVTRQREIGVDIEYVVPEFATLEIAEKFFSAGEVTALRNLPPNDLIEGFFNCWVRKEAYIKALGKGLSIPLDQFEVSLDSSESDVTLTTARDQHDVNRRSLRQLFPAKDYAAAVAVEGHRWRVKCWRYVDSFALY